MKKWGNEEKVILGQASQDQVHLLEDSELGDKASPCLT